MSSRPQRALVRAAALAIAVLVAGGQAEDDGFKPLLDTLDGWEAVSADPQASLSDTWTLADGLLRCTGKPNGYLRTAKEYRNYVLRLEWRYPEDKDGNSGVLLHCQTPDKIWPSSVQVQLHNPEAGSTFPYGDGLKADNRLEVKDKARPVGQWNTLEMTSMDGRIAVVLNGEKLGEVTGVTPDKGHLALQSEGAEIHFRNVFLKSL